MITRTKALKLRRLIEKAVVSLTDTDALDCIELFEKWGSDKAYVIGDRVSYGGNLYKVLQDHTSHEAYPPDITVSLYARMLIPDPTVIPDWEQPSSTNPYMKGDKVRHLNKVWVSDIDYNVYEPPTMWSEVS